MQKFWFSQANQAVLSLALLVIPTARAREITQVTLKSGVKVVMIPQPDLSIVHASFLWDVGSRDETIREEGMAHLLEHLMYNGTPKYPGQSFDQMVGAQGGRTNASTTRETTLFEAWLPKDALELLARLEVDRITQSRYTSRVLQNEKRVIQAESQQNMASDPYEPIYRQLNRQLFAGTRYAHPILGEETSIRDWTLGGLQQFIKRNYTAERLTVVLSGDVETVPPILGKIPASPPRPSPDCEPVRPKEVSVVASIAGTKIFGLGYRTAGQQTESIFALNVLKKMLTSQLDKDETFEDIQVDFEGFRCHGAFFIYAQSRADQDTKQLLQLFQDRFTAFIQQPRFDVSFDNARKSLIQDLNARLETREGRSKIWQEYRYALPNLSNFDEIRQHLEALSFDNVDRELQRSFARKSVADTIQTLANGVTAVLHKRSDDTTGLSLQLRLHSGSRLDGAWPGTAALTAQALFSSSPVRVTADADSTYLTVQTTERDIDGILSVIADSLQKPDFSKFDLDSLKAWERQKLEADPPNIFAQAEEYFMSSIFTGQSYGVSRQQRLDALNGISLQHISAFHRDQYCPARVRLSVSGHFNRNNLASSIDKHFSAWKTNCSTAPIATKPVVTPANRWPVLAGSDQIVIVLGKRLPPINEAERPILEALNLQFGGSFTSVLNQELRLKSGLVYSTASKLAFFDQGAMLYALAVCSKANEAKVLEKLNELFAQFLNHAPNEEAFAHAKAILQGRNFFGIETNTAITSLLNEPEAAVSLETILNARMQVLSRSHAVESHRQVQPYLNAYPVQTIFLEPGTAGERTIM